MATKVNDNSEITIPLRNLIALLVFVTVMSIGYFELVSRISFLEHNHGLLDIHVQQNNEFRVKWPRGELGALPDDAEQNMRLQYLEKEVNKILEDMKEND